MTTCPISFQVSLQITNDLELYVMAGLLYSISLICLLFQQIKAVIVSPIECLSVNIQHTCPNGNVTFWLYNKKVQDYQLDETRMSTIANIPIVPGVKTVIILHGYRKSKSEEPNIWLRPKYMQKGYNVISVDYSKVVPRPCFRQAVANTDTIAKCVAHFIETLLSKTRITLENLLVIGFSLGGHVGGRAGKYLKEHNNTLHRLVGLDVAGPFFYGPLTYINSSCAKFVIIIHTNALLNGKFEFVGHIDFVVNSGLAQPSCKGQVNIFDIIEFMQCSHDMAPQYYAESITSNKTFCGRALTKETRKQRAKAVVMGEYTPDGSRGVYFVQTNMKPPYAKDDVCQ